jgi:hypothetical protein
LEKTLVANREAAKEFWLLETEFGVDLPELM